MPKYKFTFAKPADMIIDVDNRMKAVKIMQLRLKAMMIVVESCEEIVE